MSEPSEPSESATRAAILSAALPALVANLALGLFNLIPCPPLDGAAVLCIEDYNKGNIDAYKKAADEFLDDPDVPAALRRLVLEGQAAVKRSLKAREFDAARA